MSRDIAVFIHAACIDGVEKRIEQYASILQKSRLHPPVKKIFVCYVGNDVPPPKPSLSYLQYIHVSQNLDDYELPTQNLLWKYAHFNPTAKILYLHTKGVGKGKNECIEDWINYMLYFCVEQWETAVEQLETNDTVGVDLLEAPTLHYSGNFWWANASYIKTLPSPGEFADLHHYPNPLNSPRHNQEFWICYKRQKHCCLWQSNINCYERHLHLYPRNLYNLKISNKTKQMTESLCIFFLTGVARGQFLPTIVENLSNCKYKKNIHFLILTDTIDTETKYHDALKDKEIPYSISSFGLHDNYMSKIRFALEFVKTRSIPYMMKHDNDILCSPYLYDFLFENKDLLLDEKTLLLTPTLTSGIPSVEQFLSDFCSKQEQDEMKTLFRQYIFGTTWGVDYSSLNKHTLFGFDWNALEYFKSVKEIQHPYRGIHPIRMYDKAIYRLNDLVLKYKGKLMSNSKIELVYDNVSPYFCNSIYLIRSDIYSKIINTPELFIDPYDEVPVNEYRNINKLNIAYTQNAAAIHPIYNSIVNSDTYEKEFQKRYLEEYGDKTFEDILMKYQAFDTSKGTDKNTSHSYGSVYSELFAAHKAKLIELLEIGFDGGASLLAYAEYFNSADIYGLDIQDHRLESVKTHEHIHTRIEDALLYKNSFQKMYDIIIEDASHEVSHQIQHFIDFGSSVKPGGLYIIEDVHEQHVKTLQEGILPSVINYGFTLEIKDLRSIKNRFDDILFILKKQI